MFKPKDFLLVQHAYLAELCEVTCLINCLAERPEPHRASKASPSMFKTKDFPSVHDTYLAEKCKDTSLINCLARVKRITVMRIVLAISSYCKMDEAVKSILRPY